jgi:hypothetical protein
LQSFFSFPLKPNSENWDQLSHIHTSGLQLALGACSLHRAGQVGRKYEVIEDGSPTAVTAQTSRTRRHGHWVIHCAPAYEDWSPGAEPARKRIGDHAL